MSRFWQIHQRYSEFLARYHEEGDGGEPFFWDVSRVLHTLLFRGFKPLLASPARMAILIADEDSDVPTRFAEAVPALVTSEGPGDQTSFRACLSLQRTRDGDWPILRVGDTDFRLGPMPALLLFDVWLYCPEFPGGDPSQPGAVPLPDPESFDPMQSAIWPFSTETNRRASSGYGEDPAEASSGDTDPMAVQLLIELLRLQGRPETTFSSLPLAPESLTFLLRYRAMAAGEPAAGFAAAYAQVCEGRSAWSAKAAARTLKVSTRDRAARTLAESNEFQHDIQILLARL